MVTYFQKLRRQVKALSEKNIYYLKNRWLLCLVLVLSPIIIHPLYQKLSTHTSTADSLFDIPLNDFPKCVDFDVKGNPYTPSKQEQRCLTIVYAPKTEETNEIMNDFAKKTGLKMDTDIIGESTKLEYYKHVYPPYNSSIQYAVSGVYFDLESDQPSYHIWCNATYYQHIYGNDYISPAEVCYLKIQNFLEASINNNTEPMNLSITSIPIVMKENDSSNGYSELFVLGICFTVFASILIMDEKKGKMIQYLRSFGLYEASTIYSYFLSFFLLSLITSLIFEVFGFVYHVHYLIKLPYGFTTLWCTLYLTGMCYVGYFISSFTSRLWCYGIALAIIGSILYAHTTSDLYYIFFYSPDDILFKLPSPIYLACYLLNTVQLITTITKRPFTWRDCFSLFDYSRPDFPIGVPIVVLCYVLGAIVLFCYIWYFSYKNAYNYGCWFFCSGSFWNPKAVIRFESVDNREKDSIQSEKNHSIIFSYATKLFESCTAVKELHVEIAPNQVFTLLGPNGSGKTTSISLLTGVYPTTYGDIYVDGESVSKSHSTIQDRFGVCTQFDYFWPHFTPRQMFSIMGSFKGIPKNILESERDRLLKTFDLDKSIDHDIDKFSGGMKRKVSLSLSCMDYYDIIVLDEPTSGMDPISRSQVWKVISELKKKHTVILTTHSMEEADALSDKIGIMYLGRLRAIGSAEDLKKAFGKGYKVDVLLNDGQLANPIFDCMRAYMPNSEMISYTTAQLSIGIDSEDLQCLPRFLADVNKAPCTKEWFISPSTLDEVFIKVIQDNRDVAEANKILQEQEAKQARKIVQLCTICGMNPAEPVTIYNKKGKPFTLEGVYCRHCMEASSSEEDEDTEETHSLLDKPTQQPTESTEQTGAVTLDSLSDEFSLTKPLIEESSTEENKNVLTNKTNLGTSFFTVMKSLIWLHMKLTFCDFKRIILPILLVAGSIIAVRVASIMTPPIQDCSDGSYFSYPITCVDNNKPPVWYLDSDATYFKSSIQSSTLSIDSIPSIHVQYSNNTPLSILVDDSHSTLKVSNLHWAYNLSDIDTDYSDYYSFISSTDLNKDMLEKEKYLLHLIPEYSDFYYIHTENMTDVYNFLFSTIPQVTMSFKGTKEKWSSSLGFHLVTTSSNTVESMFDEVSSNDIVFAPWMITLLNNMFTYQQEKTPSSYIPAKSVFMEKTYVYSLSSYTLEVLLLCCPLIFVLVSCYQISRIVEDCTKDYISLLSRNNARWIHYLSTSFIFWFLFNLVYTIVIFVFFSFNNTISRFINFSSLFFVIGSLHSVAFGLFLSSIMNSVFSAIFLHIVLNSVCLLMYYYSISSSILFNFIPANFYYVLCKHLFAPSDISYTYFSSSIVIACIAILIYCIATYIIWYSRYDLFNFLDKYYQLHRHDDSKPIEENQAIEMNDEGTQKEAEYVHQIFGNHNPSGRSGNSLIVMNVSKNFYLKKGVKHVFPDVSFAIKDCEVFGLLGPNGAGKTTLINILTGKLNPSSGKIKVMGYPISSYVIASQIGVVPQFDLLFDNLTVADHLHLIALLHNVSLNRAHHQAKILAEQIGLDRDAFYHKASLLSGGQKRRLTLGMAMMSQPRVLLLDEPTTGLDPESRYAIWETVKKIQQNMSIVITTHSMEEADALCSRIAIMTNDGIQCLGTPIHLKNLYGKGFLFTVTFDSCVNDPIEYVKTHISSHMELLETKFDSLVFAVEKEKIDFSQFLLQILNLQKKHIIHKWSINESSLSDVFERICRKYE